MANQDVETRAGAIKVPELEAKLIEAHAKADAEAIERYAKELWDEKVRRAKDESGD